MLTNPRTLCACQPVVFKISARVAPFARFMMAITSAFLLLPSRFGFRADFFERSAFLAADLVYFPRARLAFDFVAWGSGAVLSTSTVLVLIFFSLTGCVRGRHIDRSERKNMQVNCDPPALGDATPG